MPEKLAYKRLENDDELRARACGKWCPSTFHGDKMDDHAWEWHRKQRRIVEVFP